MKINLKVEMKIKLKFEVKLKRTKINLDNNN